jgi:hypothetical protein
MTAMGVPHHRSACRVNFVGFGELLPGICAKLGELRVDQ